MIQHKAIVYFPSIAFLFVCSSLYAQPPADTTSKKKIIILNAERLNYQKIDSAEFQSAAGNVKIRQDSTLFYTDSVVLNKTKNTLEAFGHVHINDNDSIHTYSDYLRYFGNEKKAYLKGNVKLTDGKGTLTTPDLDYDLNTHIGIYTKNGKVVSEKTVLTSKEGYYYGETKDVYFKKDVVLVNPDYTITTDTLLFNTYTNVATFTVPTIINSGDKKKIFTSDGYYDLAKKKAYFGKRPHIEDSTTMLDADIVASNDSTRDSEASGHVIYRDTAQGVTIIANNLKSKGEESSLLATQKPVMIIKQDKDSTFLAADTLFSGRLSTLKKFRNIPAILDSLPATDPVVLSDSARAKQDSARDRFVEAYRNVKIFSDSLQAVGDSLFYSSEDSAFRLFKDPVVWSRESQISGDTIYLFTLNKKPKRMYVFENALSVEKVGPEYYNQVKGRTINGYFTNGELDSVRAKGNAESIYYAQDDSSKFISANRATSDVIDMYFRERQADKVVFRSNVIGTAYPMRQANPFEMRLRSFKWLVDRRPKTKYELFGN
ncbi:OstA-like protein [Parafilimonas sp.]|uniref:OstA-like protein n=1 Tax=Parafilimonas sp. TaxID=1969739 RepID=UPI0039E469D0